METLKVSANSRTKALAGALTAAVRNDGAVELQAIGAGAVNQAIKAIAVARGFIAPQGISLVVIPSFVKILIDDQERTAIKFLIEPR